MFNIWFLLRLSLLFCAICSLPLLASVERPCWVQKFVESIKSVNNLDEEGIDDISILAAYSLVDSADGRLKAVLKTPNLKKQIDELSRQDNIIRLARRISYRPIPPFCTQKMSLWNVDKNTKSITDKAIGECVVECDNGLVKLQEIDPRRLFSDEAELEKSY